MRNDINALKIDRDSGKRNGGVRWSGIVITMIVVVVGTLAVYWWLQVRVPRGPQGAAPGPAAAGGSRGSATERPRSVPAGGESAAEPAGKDPATSSAGPRATVLNASGYVTARRRATISAKVTGKLTEVLVEEGMPVEAGQVLARLDDSLHQANLSLARSQLVAARKAVAETVSRRELAELTLGRTRRLFEEGVVGQADLDEASSQYQSLRAREALDREQVAVAESQVALRETELKDTVVRAPYGGIVISKDAQEGEMVSPISAGGGFTRTGICTIVDMGSLEIEVDVNESYIARVAAGQPVEAVLDAYPDWRIPGHVITTIPAADRQKATVRVRIAFDQLDDRILPDMGVKVAFRRETE